MRRRHYDSAAYGVFGRDNTGWVSAGTKLRFHQGTYNPDSGKLCVVVLQARVRPGSRYAIEREVAGRDIVHEGLLHLRVEHHVRRTHAHAV